MADAELKLEGFKELGEALRQLDSEMRSTIGFRAFSRLQRQTKDDAVKNAYAEGLLGPSGALIRNIAIARINTGSSLSFIYDFCVRHGTKKQIKQSKFAGKNVNDPWYWFLHEFGYHDRAGVEHPGTGFMTKAFEKRKGDGLEMMAATMRKGIDKACEGNKK